MGSVVNVEQRPLYPRERDQQARIVKETGRVPGPVTIYILHGKLNTFSTVTGIKRQSQYRSYYTFVITPKLVEEKEKRIKICSVCD
jgi:hypothetical protein